MPNFSCVRTVVVISTFLSCLTHVNAQTSVPIKPKIIRDLSGYWVHGGGGNNPFNWFDGYGTVDPKNGVTTFPSSNRADTTQALPFRNFPDYYPRGFNPRGYLQYNGNRGLRMVFDLAGDKDALKDLKYSITDIYAYDNTFYAGDSIFFYNFDNVLAMPVAERWKYLARPDSLLTPFATLVTQAWAANPAGSKWINVNTNDSMRYILVRVVTKDRGNFTTYPQFGELVIYGSPAFSGSVNPRPTTYSGPLPAKIPLSKFVGTNQGSFADTSQLIYDGNIRDYEAVQYYDNTSSDYPNNTYNFNPWSWTNAGLHYPQALKNQGRFLWASIRGCSHYMVNATGGNGGQVINTNHPGDEPENPFSYTRSGDFFYNYAAKYGSNPAASGTRWVNDAGFPNGLNYYDAVENGNEDEFVGLSILGYMMKSFVDYDGWEGRVGTGLGIKNADPNFKMVMSASVYMDSNRVDCYVWLSKILRSDGKFPFSIINNHHYSRTYDNKIDYNPMIEQQVGEKGESPEKDLMYDKLNSYTNFYYNILDGDTSVKVFLTEWGYDNFPDAPPSVAALNSLWTISGTPLVPGYDNLQSKALMMLRGETIMAATGLRGYNEFMFHNAYYGPNTINMLFATSGRTTADPMASVKFPWYWYRAGLYTYLKNYYPDAVLSNNGDNLWVIRWKNMQNPDSVCYQVWKGSYNGSSLPNQSISIGAVAGSTASQVELSFTQATGTVTTVPAGGGYLTINALEKPLFYFVKQDTATIINQLPVANAGPDQNLPTVTVSTALDGSASSDPDGTIVSYKWVKISGANGVVITSDTSVSPTITGLLPGVYVFELSVTDDKGAIARDQVTITVILPPNQPPVANAGADISMTLPTNGASLDGTGSMDPDGSIVTYSWTKLSGPAQYTLVNPGAAATSLNNLVQGVYSFILTVTDNRGATAADTVVVTVNPGLPPPNQPPVANAGPDISITLPVNSAILNGSGSSDPDGAVVSYAWTKISGPAQYLLVNAGNAVANVSNLVAGVYSFRLQVVDNNGAASADTMVITVGNATAVNQPPVANAGADKTLSTPGNVTLDGTASYDPDGNVVQYSWVQTSGQAGATIVNSTTAQPTITGLQQGVYIFQLTVTDNNGATATATVKITVGTVTNQLPVAKAGNDISISYPNAAASLNGSASFDPDGSIVSYSWKQVSGPSAASILQPNSSVTNIQQLVAGDYLFELTVTDNSGATAKDTVKVSVVVALRFTETIKVYPNPIIGSSFTIDALNETRGKVRVVLFDAGGKLILENMYDKQSDSFSQQITVPALSSGLYVLNVQFYLQDKPFVFKLVK